MLIGPTTPVGQSTTKRLWIVAGSTLLMLCGAAALHMCYLMPRDRQARRHWKNDAVVQIRGLSSDTNWVNGQVTSIMQWSQQYGSYGGWFTDHLLLMKNGDWIAFANKCHKEDPRVRDIFVGRASDGKWYYSTYHFCIGMKVLKVEPQPEDLKSFAGTYFLHEFDGESDEAIGRTWPTR